MKYRKKPVVIEAIRWTGQEEREVDNFFTPAEHESVVSIERPECGDLCDHEVDVCEGDNGYLLIGTLEGVMRADPGDWIIRGVQGELYPCKPNIFHETYEPVEEG